MMFNYMHKPTTCIDRARYSLLQFKIHDFWYINEIRSRCTDEWFDDYFSVQLIMFNKIKLLENMFSVTSEKLFQFIDIKEKIITKCFSMYKFVNEDCEI